MKLGLALSGGGIRGIAHAGVLKALEDNKIKIDVIGGTSSGGIIAALYAMGYSPYYIFELFKRYAKDVAAINGSTIISGIKAYKMTKNSNVKGLNSGELLEKEFDKIANKKGIKIIKDINMPIAIPTVDISNVNKYVFTNSISKEKNTYYITDINIGKAIRATSCFPGVFNPVKYKNHMFLDGGILDNVPVEEVRKKGATKVMAVNFAADEVNEQSNAMDIIMRTIDAMGNKISDNNLQSSDYVLTVPTDKTGLLDVEKLDSCFKYGYESVVNNLEKIKKLQIEN
ncbi:MAG: patatin-like phospholipase family protein [Clostridia bacterium]|nr:patatin-like phospholipase family protein [Clostridia bacterium]